MNRFRRNRSGGYTFVELLLVMALMALTFTVAVAAWNTSRRSAESLMTARMVQGCLIQARMLSVYRGLNHFLVLDPNQRSITIYEDSGTTKGRFDNGDAKVRGESWPSSVNLQMPPSSASVPDPMGGSNLTAAWSLPLPNSSDRWGSTLRGLMTTPTGRIQSGESSPQTISTGTMIFSDSTSQVSAVGIRGQFGSATPYRMLNSAWTN